METNQNALENMTSVTIEKQSQDTKPGYPYFDYFRILMPYFSLRLGG